MLDLSLKVKKVSMSNIHEDMEDLTDSDFNGENGIEYVSEEAMNLGFDSNLDFAISRAAIAHHGDLKKIISEVLEECYGDSSYYRKMTYHILELDESTMIVSVAYNS